VLLDGLVFNGDLLQATRHALPLMLIFQQDDTGQRNLTSGSIEYGS